MTRDVKLCFQSQPQRMIFQASTSILMILGIGIKQAYHNSSFLLLLLAEMRSILCENTELVYHWNKNHIIEHTETNIIYPQSENKCHKWWYKLINTFKVKDAVWISLWKSVPLPTNTTYNTMNSKEKHVPFAVNIMNGYNRGTKNKESIRSIHWFFMFALNTEKHLFQVLIFNTYFC